MTVPPRLEHVEPLVDIMDTTHLLDIEPPVWLVPDFIAEKSTTMIYGPWGLGKSFLTLDMVLTATTGGEWFGGRVIDRPLKTLYIVAEGAAWWPPRIRAFQEGRQDIDESMVLWYPKPVQLWTHNGQQSPDFLSLERTIYDEAPDVLVIDTWVRCTMAYGMNENDSGGSAQVYRHLDRLRDEYNVVPLIVHHPKKDEDGFRGSGNQAASLERVIKLERIKNEPSSFRVVDEKGNHMQPFDPFAMRFEQFDLSDGDGSAILSYEGPSERKRVTVAHGVTPAVQEKLGGMTTDYKALKQFLVEQCGVAEGSVSNTINKLAEEGAVAKLSKGMYKVAPLGE